MGPERSLPRRNRSCDERASGRYEPVARLIAIHRKLIHAGVEHIYDHIREKYWILHGRAEIKNCTVKCPLCFRRRVKPMTHKMVIYRMYVSQAQASLFGTLGLTMQDRLRRIGPIERENAICLFTCLHMRAVHLEVAHSLDTDSCIMALRRFQARRGVPVCMTWIKRKSRSS
jgi:hypothetical protein